MPPYRKLKAANPNPSVGALKRILDGVDMDLARFFSFELSAEGRYFYKSSDLKEIGRGKVVLPSCRCGPARQEHSDVA